MFITTYNSANPNFRDIISKHWSFLGRSSATRELCNQDIMVTSESHLLWKTCWLGLKSHNPKQEMTRAAQDPILVNIVQDYPNQGE